MNVMNKRKEVIKAGLVDIDDKICQKLKERHPSSRFVPGKVLKGDAFSYDYMQYYVSVREIDQDGEVFYHSIEAIMDVERRGFVVDLQLTY